MTTGPPPRPGEPTFGAQTTALVALPTFYRTTARANTAGAGGRSRSCRCPRRGWRSRPAYDATSGFYGPVHLRDPEPGTDTYQFTLLCGISALTELEAVDANPDLPVLGIQILDANTSELFWPLIRPGFRLEETADPAPGPRRLVPEAVNTVGDLSVRRAPNASTDLSPQN